MDFNTRRRKKPNVRLTFEEREEIRDFNVNTEGSIPFRSNFNQVFIVHSAVRVGCSQGIRRQDEILDTQKQTRDDVRVRRGRHMHNWHVPNVI